MTTASHFSLLVIDDEPDLRTLYELTLLREGYDMDTAGSVQEALLHLKDRTYSAVITDMRLPDGSGLDVLRWLEESGRREKAIVITAYGSAENAVEALKAGAYDYLTKPVDLKQFRAVVASALGRGGTHGPMVVPANLPSEQRVTGAARPPRPAPPPSPTVATSAALSRMAGLSATMQQVRSMVEKVARSMAPVLVSGESGTGKELVARAIHEVSTRAPQAFIPVNCSAIPEQLLEAEFFGYRKGAFTGAADDREGLLSGREAAARCFSTRSATCRCRCNRSCCARSRSGRSGRSGAVAELPVDVRILSATHKDLAAEVQAGQFRQDLYYRLNVIQIRVPPLRERVEDLAVVSERVLERLSREAGVWPAPQLTREALVHLSRYPFPGNVRELENLLHRAVALSGGELIDVYDLSLPDSGVSGAVSADAASAASLAMVAEVLQPPVPTPAPPIEEPLPNDLEKYLDQVEREILVRALEQHRYNRTAAGSSLGLSLRQIRYRMARLGVNVGGDLAGAERE
jgi:two-component system response regulator PilR (NtrC family)